MYYDFFFWLNRWYLPLILSGLLFYFVYSKKTWIDRINKIQNKKQRDFLLFALGGLKINLGNWRMTVLFPAFIAIGLYVIIAIIFNVNAGGYGEPILFAIFTSGFLNPIAEEFIMRGIFLGVFFAYAAFILPKYKNTVYLFGLLITSVIFLLGHNNPELYHVVARFSASILLGLLYLINDRNLLPPIIAHAAGNIFLILSDASRGIY